MLKEQKNQPPRGEAASQDEAPPGIVSVNSRGGASGDFTGKLLFAGAILAVLVVAALMSFNKWRDIGKARQIAAEQSEKEQNKPRAAAPHRLFDTDPPPLPPGARPKATADARAVDAGAACADGMPSLVMRGPDGKELVSPDGALMRVCKDGRMVVPAVQPLGTQAIPLAGGRQGSNVPQNRYAGDVMLPVPNGQKSNGATANPADPNSVMAVGMMQNTLGTSQQAQGTDSGGGFGAAPGPGLPMGKQASAANPPGSLGNQLTPSQTPAVQASLIGDRNMILPKGRTIDCGLSMRLASDVAGMATCVLSQNVYSDNGHVLLLERGSEASGEYVAAMAQGQRRLFVLWTRIKTPGGVIINLNSPAADGLGTSGMDGYVDNHWWQRIGAAFLLSLVQDAIAYETAKTAAGKEDSGQSLAIFQNSAATGNKFAEKVLDSSINIKPTLYKNQGDRGTIFVARDLNFGTVYALRAR